MNRKLLITTGITMIITIVFVIAYIVFNAFDMTFTQNKRIDLTIATSSDEKLYDGTPLINETWYIKEGSLQRGHTIQYVMPSTITDAGTVTNDIGITILDEEGIDVTSDYHITYELGELTVLKIPLTIMTFGGEKDYDGEPLMVPEWMIY